MKITKRPPNHFTNLEIMEFGLCQLIDGLVRLLSLGFYFSSSTLDCSRKQTERIIKLRRYEREKRNNN